MSKVATRWIEDDAVDKDKINADVAGDGLVQAAGGELDVNVDGSTLETNADVIRIKDLGVGTAKYAATSLTAAKLGSDVAGDGISGGNGADLDVDPDVTGGANLARAINVSANGVAVKTDDATIDEDGSQRLRVVPNGIGAAELDETDNYTHSGTNDFTGGTVHVPTPTADTHPVTKAYADAAREGILRKGVVRALRDTNIAVTGDPGTVDGVASWVTGQRIFCIAQTAGAENGPWEVNTAGAWTRPDDFATGSSASGAVMWIDQGTIYGDKGDWTCFTDKPNDVVDTNSLSFQQTGGGGLITAGTGLTRSGLDIRVGDGSTGDKNGINRTADELGVATDGTTLEVSAEKVQIKDLGVGTAKYAASSLTAAKLGSDVAGNGLTGGSGAAIAALDDPTGGANLSKSVNVSANGLAVKVDAATIEEGVSSRLRVKDAGIDENKLNASVAGNGISGGGGAALALDINGIATAEATPDDADLIAIYDNTAVALRKMTRANFLSGLAAENIVQYMHVITGAETTAGFFTLPTVPTNKQSVRVTPVDGPHQTNKQVVGATGATPDFDILGAGNDEVHFNNNGAAIGLSQDLTTGDVVIVEYQD